MTTVFYAKLYGRFLEIQSNLRRKKLYRMNQGSNRVNVRALIQRERQPQQLNDFFQEQTDPFSCQ